MVTLPWRTPNAARVDPAREYLCLATFLPLKRFRMVPRFFRYFRQVNEQLGSTKGLVGYSMRAAILHHRFWTVSAWENETALAAFVAAHPHMDVMGHLSPHMGPTTFVRWRAKGSELPPTWDAALAKIAAG